MPNIPVIPSHQSEFIRACRRGDIEQVDRIIQQGGVSIHDDNELGFRMACECNHPRLAMHLMDISNDIINVRINNDYAFKAAYAMESYNSLEFLVSLFPSIYSYRWLNYHTREELVEYDNDVQRYNSNAYLEARINDVIIPFF